MSVQDLERRVSELEAECKDLQENFFIISQTVNRYEAMTTGVKWVFVILSGIAAFVASIKAVFGKFFAY